MTRPRAYSCCLVCGDTRIIRTIVGENDSEWIILGEDGSTYPLRKAVWGRETP